LGEWSPAPLKRANYGWAETGTTEGMSADRAVGIVGLGRIGGGLALQARAKGWRVVGLDPAFDPELAAAGVERATSLADLAQRLPVTRQILLYVHAGSTVDDLLTELAPHLTPGDVVADGGNSYWGDSRRRAAQWLPQGWHLADVGTSGGLSGAKNGACFMVGGDPAAEARLRPLLTDLAVPGGYVYTGPSGAGHFVKLVHNGIEFGMLQAIGEGVHLMEAFDTPLPLPEVLEAWRHGTVVRSWLVDLMAEAYTETPDMQTVPGVIEDTGEVNWLVADALEMEVPIPVIAQSVQQLFASRDDERPWARAIALMRKGFGGHPLGRAPALATERRTSRVGDIWRHR